jgi:hypothetical protein
LARQMSFAEAAHKFTRMNDFNDLSALLCNFFRACAPSQRLVLRRREVTAKNRERKAPTGAPFETRRFGGVPQDEARHKFRAPAKREVRKTAGAISRHETKRFASSAPSP